MLNIRDRVSVYIFTTDKILIVGKSMTPLWSKYIIPGGGIENNETIYDTSLREVKEELGIRIKNLKLVNSNVKIFFNTYKIRNYDGFNNYYISADYDIDYTNIKSEFEKEQIHINKLIKSIQLNLNNYKNNNDIFNYNMELEHIKNLSNLKK